MRPGLAKKLLQKARGVGGGLSWGTGNVGGKDTTCFQSQRDLLIGFMWGVRNGEGLATLPTKPQPLA